MAWRLAGSLQALKAEVLERFPGTTIWSIGDRAHRSRASDHNPNASGVVCAIDVVGQNQGSELWNLIMDTRPDRVKYAIWKRRIVSSTTSPWVPRHYSGSNPHDTHIHISVGRGGSGRSNDPHRYDDSSPWGLVDEQPKPDPPSPPPSEDEEDEMTPDQEAKLDEVLTLLRGTRTGDDASYGTGFDVMKLLIEKVGDKFVDGVKQVRRELKATNERLDAIEAKRDG